MNSLISSVVSSFPGHWDVRGCRVKKDVQTQDVSIWIASPWGVAYSPIRIDEGHASLPFVCTILIWALFGVSYHTTLSPVIIHAWWLHLLINDIMCHHVVYLSVVWLGQHISTYTSDPKQLQVMMNMGFRSWMHEGSLFSPAAIKKPGSGHSIYNAPNMPPLQKCSAGSKSQPLRDMVQIWQMFWWRWSWWPWLSSPGAKSYHCPCHCWPWATEPMWWVQIRVTVKAHVQIVHICCENPCGPMSDWRTEMPTVGPFVCGCRNAHCAHWDMSMTVASIPAWAHAAA